MGSHISKGEKCWVCRWDMFWSSRDWRRILKILSSLIIYGFCICKFSNLLKFICNDSYWDSWHFRHLQTCAKHRKICLPMHAFPAKVKQGGCCAVCFRCYTEMTRGWTWEGAIQCSAKSSTSGASWKVFESQLWHQLVGPPQASDETLLNLIFSFVKKIESTRMN